MDDVECCISSNHDLIITRCEIRIADMTSDRVREAPQVSQLHLMHSRECSNDEWLYGLISGH